MTAATFTGHAPAVRPPFEQIQRPELSEAEREQVRRFQTDIRRHVARRNRHDAERALQSALYRAQA